MKVLLLSGSVGKKSCTRTMLQYLASQLIARGVDTVFWDLGERPLPIAIPEFFMLPDKNPNKIVGEFVAQVKKVDGVILGSPLYHGSYSGVLKNALDNLPKDGFLYKPVGLVSHSSNARSCVRPSYDLRPIVGSLGGYPTRVQIGTTNEDFEEANRKLKLTNKKIQARGEELITELLELATLLGKHA